MYQLRDTHGHYVSRSRSLAAAHRASRQKNRAGAIVLNCAHGTSLRKKRAEVVKKYAEYVRQSLKQLGAKEGYVVFANFGPYDHNPNDYPLPLPDFPRVFRALYEAVEYAQEQKGWGKVKISRVDGSTVPGTQALASTIVWRSWTPGEHGGWSEDPALNRALASGEGLRPMVIERIGKKFGVYLNMHGAKAFGAKWSSRARREKMQAYGDAMIPIVRAPGGGLDFGQPGGEPTKLTKGDAEYVAHKIGHYVLGLGDFVSSYTSEVG